MSGVDRRPRGGTRAGCSACTSASVGEGLSSLDVTFSIVACDPVDGSWGVAVASRFLAVGANVPAAEVDAGALATQALTNMAYRRSGLAMLRAGEGAKAVVDSLVAGDDGREARQVGVVDAHGGAAVWTGSECQPWAGSRTGNGFAVQGNLLHGPEVVDAMAQAWLAGDGSAALAHRLLAALAAGDAAGGDRRGRQSAALYVARRGSHFDAEVDLRVDDAPHPVDELARLLALRYDGR